MISSDQLLLLTFSALALIIFAESHRTILLEEKEEDTERLLNYINKPAIKSFRTEHGDVFDCIDIRKQLAFDNPLLKNHSIQLRPTITPKWTINKNNSQTVGSQPLRQDSINCPLGTVIIKRTTMEDLIQDQRLKSMGSTYSTYVSSKDKNVEQPGQRFAVSEYKFSNYGGKANMSIWEPKVSSNQLSLTSMNFAGGSEEQFQSISAGWIVYEWLNKNHTRLYTFWTADGFKKTGCYNTLCPGFVQVSTKFPLGFLLEPVSSVWGQQYELSIKVYKEESLGDWWLEVLNERVGYWPQSLFTDTGLGHEASMASWGGQVYSPVREKSPEMGSGLFPHSGYKRAAYVNGIEVIDYVTGEVESPEASALEIVSSAPDCYDVIKGGNIGPVYSTSMYYGGPGGCTF